MMAVIDLNKIKKGGNKRCPFRNQCGKICEHAGAELGCNYYKYNAQGDDVIEDQERIRELLEEADVRQRDEAMISAMDDEPMLVMLRVNRISPHPNNPRKALGDLSELTESIKAKGIMQNLTVVPYDGNYRVIIGHRRLAAAKRAGLTEVPCVIVEMSEQEQLATMLLENIQRSDLTAYEQAKGFQMMMDFGDSVGDIVSKTGFSETTVRRRLKMAELDGKVLERVSARQISFGDIDKLAEIEDVEVRNRVLEDIGTVNFNNKLKSALDNQKRDRTLEEMREAFKAAGLYEIEGKDYSKHSYQATISTLDGIEKAIERAKGLGAVGFYHGYATSFYMMSKKDEGESEYQIKERERKERVAKLEEAFERAYQLRREFIKDYSLREATLNLNKISALLACLGMNEDLRDSISKEDYEALLFGRERGASSYEEFCNLIEISDAGKSILVAVWLLADSEGIDCCDWQGMYRENAALNMIYEFLESLGYEMSDEERGLIEGTDERYLK